MLREDKRVVVSHVIYKWLACHWMPIGEKWCEKHSSAAGCHKNEDPFTHIVHRGPIWCQSTRGWTWCSGDRHGGSWPGWTSSSWWKRLCPGTPLLWRYSTTREQMLSKKKSRIGWSELLLILDTNISYVIASLIDHSIGLWIQCTDIAAGSSTTNCSHLSS